MKHKFEIGKRYLVIENRPLGFEIEIEVLEISPSGKRVKFRYPSNAEDWELASDYIIVEGLGL